MPIVCEHPNNPTNRASSGPDADSTAALLGFSVPGHRYGIQLYTSSDGNIASMPISSDEV